MMDERSIARILIEQLRRYMREKTGQNNIVAVPALDLLAWGVPSDTSWSQSRVEAAADLLHRAKLCVVVFQHTPVGPPQLRLQMTPEGRDMTDAEVLQRIAAQQA